MGRMLGYAGKLLGAAVIAAIVKTIIEHQAHIRLGGVVIAGLFLGSYFLIDFSIKRFKGRKRTQGPWQ